MHPPAATRNQTPRPLTVDTPLGRNALEVRSFAGHEALSELFKFHLEVVEEHGRSVAFGQLLGQSITVNLPLPNGESRPFNGLCARVSQGETRDNVTPYHLVLVPRLWLLTKRAQSRIFQQMTVPDILRVVFSGLPVNYDHLQGPWHPRDYCVQYRESDFHFASRLMEEEGIYYYFTHEAGGHPMIVANAPWGHADLPAPSRVPYRGTAVGPQDEGHVSFWEKSQELRAGRYLLWDHCFELPHVHLEGPALCPPSVQAGDVTHSLRLANNDKLEIFDWPGEYAQRFDGVAPGGGDRQRELQRVYEDNRRTAGIRMEQETAPALVIRGAGTCRRLLSGHKFTLDGLPHANGAYVLTSVQHTAGQGGASRSGPGATFHYSNQFTCIPIGLRFRPQRVTPKPVIQGTQTAVVVGPEGEEIFVDRYGRVKVQFHWDRQGESDADSSCWVRVAQVWAGKRWGASFWPRVGQEVVVAFEEGDPDKPIVLGSVYNAAQLPPYLGLGSDPGHKDNPRLSGIKTCSTKAGSHERGGQGFNELRFDDSKGGEQVFLHAQNRMDVRARGALYETSHGDRHTVVGWQDGERQGGDYRLLVHRHHDVHVNGSKYERVEERLNLRVVGDAASVFGGDHQTRVHGLCDLNAREIILEALDHITLVVGDSFIRVDLTGITIKGPQVKINSGGSSAQTGDLDVLDPADAEAADTGEPGHLDRRHGDGAAPHGRTPRHVAAQHGISGVALNADGTFQAGSGIRVRPGRAPNFAANALRDLSLMMSTRRGRTTIADLNTSGHIVTIEQRPPNPRDPFNAATGPAPETDAAMQDGTAAGVPIRDAQGNTVPDANGNPLVGTGRGTDSTVAYDPSLYPVPQSRDPHSEHNAPSDAILNHELTHVDHLAHGQGDLTPTGDGFDNREELHTIGNPDGPDNDYRAERGVEQRRDHVDY